MHTDCRVAVASRSFSRNASLRTEIAGSYRHVTFNETGASLAGEALAEFLRGHDRAVIALESVDAALLDALPGLRVISKYGVGLDSLDLDALEARGVRLGWTGGVNRRSVAELVIGSAISLLHRVPIAAQEVKDGVWRQTVGRQLTGRTVGIIGCGHVGKEVARLARAFDCRVLAHDILDFPEFYRERSVTPVSLEAALREPDVVTVHLPLDASTRRMLSAERLALLRPDAVFVNMARGGIVDEAALCGLLAAGRLWGAAVDVFEVEPPVERALIALPNVIATPHIGGSTEEAILAMGRAAIAGLDAAKLPSEHGLL
jgi:D-3-phosphoglycerate dehydrogenase